MKDESTSPIPVLPKTFVFNCFAFVLCGALLLGWRYRYTSWFDPIGGFLSLAGVLSWLAFVLKVIPEKRMEEFQPWADSALINNAWSKWIVLGFLGISLVTAKLHN
jgi:hypothetical protein